MVGNLEANRIEGEPIHQGSKVQIEPTRPTKLQIDQLAGDQFDTEGVFYHQIIINSADLQTSALVYILEKGAIEDKYRNLYAQLI